MPVCIALLFHRPLFSNSALNACSNLYWYDHGTWKSWRNHLPADYSREFNLQERQRKTRLTHRRIRYPLCKIWISKLCFLLCLPSAYPKMRWYTICDSLLGFASHFSKVTYAPRMSTLRSFVSIAKPLTSSVVSLSQCGAWWWESQSNGWVWSG